MTPFEVAELLERFASAVTKLPGVSRINPHAFAEAKSELYGEMMLRARELRTVPRQRPSLPVTAIAPGARSIRGRIIRVESRR